MTRTVTVDPATGAVVLPIVDAARSAARYLPGDLAEVDRRVGEVAGHVAHDRMDPDVAVALAKVHAATAALRSTVDGLVAAVEHDGQVPS